MKHQLQTIRHHLEPLANNSGVRKALTTLSELERMAGEPVAKLHDDGYWTPMKTEAGRALNEHLMRAGSPSIDVYAAPPAQQTVTNDEQASAYMDARLWEFIDMAGAWPTAKPDPRIWAHVMVYAPPAQQPQEPVKPCCMNFAAGTNCFSDPRIDCPRLHPVAQQPQGEVVVTWNRDLTRILAVTRQDREGRILKVIAEAPAQQPQAEPDAYCSTTPDGGCISTDPRCIHQPQAEKPLAPLEPASSYVQPVPDHCDRIVWRNRYYYLPLKQPQAEAVPSDVVRDAERWRMLPAYFYEYQIDSMKLCRDIDAAIAQQKGGV